MSRSDNRCRDGHGATCSWPVKQKQRATIKALGVLQRNLGRRITAVELTYLSGSEIWHELLYRLIRGQTIALPWAYVDEGPTEVEELEEMIASGLAPYHADRPQQEEVLPSVTPPPATGSREARIASAKAARRKHRGDFYGV